jgi:hypothetical protein
MKRRLRRIAVRLLALVTVVYIAFAAILAFSQTSLIYPRHMIEAPMPDADIPAFVERWWIESREGDKVEAWFIPGEGRSDESPGPAAILLHGNGELIDHNLRTAALYTGMGISVLMPEYRGYGRCTGTPGQAAITQDLLAFHAKLIARPEIDPTRLIYHGESLGTGYACVLADLHPPRAIILNSPFRSMTSMAAKFFLPGFLVTSPLRSDLALAKDPAPVLIFHGKHDNVVPFTQGLALSKIAPRCEFVELDCGHNDLPPPPGWTAYESRIKSFLQTNGVLDVR